MLIIIATINRIMVGSEKPNKIGDEIMEAAKIS